MCYARVPPEIHAVRHWRRSAVNRHRPATNRFVTQPDTRGSGPRETHPLHPPLLSFSAHSFALSFFIIAGPPSASIVKLVAPRLSAIALSPPAQRRREFPPLLRACNRPDVSASVRAGKRPAQTVGVQPRAATRRENRSTPGSTRTAPRAVYLFVLPRRLADPRTASAMNDSPTPPHARGAALSRQTSRRFPHADRFTAAVLEVVSVKSSKHLPRSLGASDGRNRSDAGF